MNRNHLSFAITSDGSKTLFNEEVGEHYHSRHGALQESRHVFLNTGMRYFLERSGQKNVKILEVGFGTGLNFLLSADFCSANNIQLDYTGIEAHPLQTEIIGRRWVWHALKLNRRKEEYDLAHRCLWKEN